MTIIRAEFLAQFRGTDTVVLSMDEPGVTVFNAALQTAFRRKSARLHHDGVDHEIGVRAGRSTVEWSGARVRWQLSPATAQEIFEDLIQLGMTGAGHHYVEIDEPGDTLMLSKDEYLTPFYDNWRDRGVSYD